MTWQIVGRCVEGGPLEIAGVDVWQHRWKPLGPEAIQVFDPVYRDTYKVWPYEVDGTKGPVRFAEGESSASVWMFCVEA
jgi:hypothetical protein